MKIQTTKSMAPFNGLDSVSYSMANGGLIWHDSISRNFTFGPISIVGKDLKNKADSFKYFRYDSFGNSTWDLYNDAFCDIPSPGVIKSAVSQKYLNKKDRRPIQG